jgi:hypothetical protein
MSQQQQWNQSGEEDVQMPLGVGDAPQESSEPQGKPKINAPTLVLFGAFATALLIMYLVGMQGKPRAASAEQIAHQQEMQSAITELLEKNGKTDQLEGIFKDTDKLVKMFYSYLDGDAAAVPELSHDPFANDEPRTTISPAGEAVQIVSSNAADAEKLRRVAETFSSLKLQTIMLGKPSMAVINNRMVQVGMKIGDLSVTAIEPSRVLLAYGDSKFELTLDNSSVDRH